MNFRAPVSRSLLVLCTLSCSTAIAADSAHEWLMKINYAVRMLDYEGTFVYQHDSQLEAMRIVHKMENKSAKERLVSLNGAAREVIRDANEVRCYWPDKNSVVVEYRKANDKNFPAILPERLQDLDENYTMHLAQTERIAGRMTQRVIVKPKDIYRYGYHLWSDTQTGLLLKANLVDNQGKVLEQFMFTQVNIGGNIPASALAPESSGEGLTWYREEGAAKNSDSKQSWNATRLPKGFKLSMHMTRKAPTHKKPVEHLVYTDGLAVVSVFVEKQEKDAGLTMLGLSSMGAVHAHGIRVQDYQITTVGEVPAETVSLIGSSVTPMR